MVVLLHGRNHAPAKCGVPALVRSHFGPSAAMSRPSAWLHLVLSSRRESPFGSRLVSASSRPRFGRLSHDECTVWSPLRLRVSPVRRESFFWWSGCGSVESTNTMDPRLSHLCLKWPSSNNPNTRPSRSTCVFWSSSTIASYWRTDCSLRN